MSYPIEDQARHASASQFDDDERENTYVGANLHRPSPEPLIGRNEIGAVQTKQPYFDGPAFMKAQSQYIKAMTYFSRIGSDNREDAMMNFIAAQSEFIHQQAAVFEQLGII
jgi:hypothetical protein